MVKSGINFGETFSANPNLVTLYNRLGDVYFNRIKSGVAVSFPDEKENALHCYYQALDISREVVDRYGEGNSLQNLGIIYNYLAKYQEAIKYNQQSLAISREISDRKGEAYSYMNLGNAYYFLGQYEQAREYYQQSLAIFKEIGDKPGEAKALFNVDLCFKKVQ